MPPKKKQKTSEYSNATTEGPNDGHQEEQEDQPEEYSSIGQNDPGEEDDDKSSDQDGPSLRDTSKIPEHEYVGMHRPRFDYKLERSTDSDSDTEEGGDFHDLYSKGFDAENKAGVMLEPAKDHPEHKWVIMWAGYKMFMDYSRKASYCSPDNFGMYISNDFEGWGLQELVENFIVEFDKSLKKKDEEALKHMWAIVSAMSLWINEVDQQPLMGNENGHKTQAVIGLIGWALLRALASLDFAGQLKSDTDFLDIPIVITSLHEFSKDLPEYGIEDEAVSWRPYAATYFKKGKFDNERGIFSAKTVLEGAEGGSEAMLAKKSEKDPWGWGKILGDYKKKHGTGKGGASIGGTKYDITKMSRKERASHAFDKKDPLADVSDKDLKEGNLDFV
ncbi:hypothetical protein SVAN01_03475 [Stagonosporopsis vannaccii]|nr:hypothetical protein SVAN01_03475 [Stagonosporopsis vannaccii]